MKNVCICGPYPEPVGGVSVHIRRLEASSKKHYGVTIIDEAPTRKDDVFNVRTLNLYRYYKLISAADILHVNSSVVLFRFLHVLFGCLLRKKIVVTVHSFRPVSLIFNVLNHFCFSFSDVNIVVSKEISNRFKHKHVVVPAFIRPSESELVLSEFFINLLERIKSSGKKVVVSNAYRLDFSNGEEIYGFKQLIELFVDKDVRESYSLILNVSSLDGCEDTYSLYQNYILENGLSESVYLFNEKLHFSALLANADVSIRATTTDGDALSVRESLMLGTRTIASDCVLRPSGTIIYTTGSIPSLKSALITGSFGGQVEDFSFDNEILAIYKGLL